MTPQDYVARYLEQSHEVIHALDQSALVAMIDELARLRQRGGRVFILGVGGSAANASHAVNDLRKIAGIESYAPTDNVAELTARTNDDGWETTFVEWLKTSRLDPDDALLILSVGGGSAGTSGNLVCALEYAEQVGAKILGIVSRSGGKTRECADVCVMIPPQADDTITPLAESFQALVWHCVVNAL